MAFEGVQKCVQIQENIKDLTKKRRHASYFRLNSK